MNEEAYCLSGLTLLSWLVGLVDNYPWLASSVQPGLSQSLAKSTQGS